MSWKPKAMAHEIKVQAGNFKATVIDARDTTSKSSGKEMTTVTFEVIEEGSSRGMMLWDHFRHDLPEHRKKMLRLLAAVGLADRETVENQDMIGRSLVLRIEVEEFNGMPQGRVRGFFAVKVENK